MSVTAVLAAFNEIPRELILPPSSLFLLMAIGLLIRPRFPRGGRVLTGAAVVALFILSTTAGARLFVRPLEQLTAPLQVVHNTGAQAIVVLAAGRLRDAPEYDGRDIPDYVALARLRYAARLQRATKLPVLVSGGNGLVDDTSWSKADAMAAALRDDFGVPVKWVEGKSRNTAENAAFSAAQLRPDAIRRVMLVTDAMHMARARTAFQRAGLDVVAAPTLFFSHPPLTAAAFLPSAEGLRQSWYAVYELLGIAWYRLRYHEPVGDIGASGDIR
ncbi:MAG: YdcF family protein [Oxalobacteraceae bacterium]|nr:MAG: YdcF family protein [Oxalobacteraceae bacterium]